MLRVTNPDDLSPEASLGFEIVGAKSPQTSPLLATG